MLSFLLVAPCYLYVCGMDQDTGILEELSIRDEFMGLPSNEVVYMFQRHLVEGNGSPRRAISIYIKMIPYIILYYSLDDG